MKGNFKDSGVEFVVELLVLAEVEIDGFFRFDIRSGAGLGVGGKNFDGNIVFFKNGGEGLRIVRSGNVDTERKGFGGFFEEVSHDVSPFSLDLYILKKGACKPPFSLLFKIN